MAKDNSDNSTVDFVGMPARRGRKPTGKAMTAAERMASYRDRQREKDREEMSRSSKNSGNLQVINESLEKQRSSLQETIKQLRAEAELQQAKIDNMAAEMQQLREQAAYAWKQHNEMAKANDLMQRKLSLRR
jgi:hypothetical protein